VHRRAFLAAAGTLALAGCGGGGSDDDSKSKTTATGGGEGLPGEPDDAATLRYALTFEQVQADLYRRAEATDFFKGAEREMIRTFAEQETAHVDALTDALRKAGGRPEPAPSTKLPLDDRETVLATALRLENLGASAYLGQLARIADKDVLALLVSIHSVEARHAATLSLALGKPVTPTGAFAKPENMASVLRVADLYLA
jgi:rubrerythrin